MTKSERTRNFIIESTAPIFNKKGYAGTSLSDITSATGLTKGSVYGNFENKEEVALAVFDFNREKLNRVIQEKVKRARTYQAKLMAYAQIYRSMTKGQKNNGGCAILNTAIEADDTNVPLKGRAAEALMGWEKDLAELMQEGIRAGEFRADLNINRSTLAIIALIEGGVMIARVTDDAGSMDHILDTLENFIAEMKV